MTPTSEIELTAIHKDEPSQPTAKPKSKKMVLERDPNLDLTSANKRNTLRRKIAWQPTGTLKQGEGAGPIPAYLKRQG